MRRGRTAQPEPRALVVDAARIGSGTLTTIDTPSVRDHALPLVRAILSGVLTANTLDAIVYPTGAPAAAEARRRGRRAAAAPAENLANLSGFPDRSCRRVSAPTIADRRVFLGPAFSEARLLALGYSFEQARKRAACRCIRRYDPVNRSPIGPEAQSVLSDTCL